MRVGDVVGNRFAIEGIAGAGGMGTVYRAADRLAGGPVALKMLSGIGERDAARFAREAAMLAELVHPCIVRLIAHGLADDVHHYIAMEWVDGETLHARLARGRLGLADAIAVCRAIADAIGAAHQRGVVHRDLKPGNLILVEGDLARVKVLDFGIARRIEGSNRLTRTGMVVGTPGYMAPEQVRGERELDARVDVFALGCILYRCLTGAPAFGGDEDLAVLAKILVEGVVPPSTLEPAIPPVVDALVQRMLHKDPDRRYADGRAVVAAIDAIREATQRDDREATVATASTSARIAVTDSEQRLVSIVLAVPMVGGGLDRGRVGVVATAFGGRTEPVSDGATLVLFAHAEIAGDHAARAARCALALRETSSGVGFVVATGRAAVGGGLASGDVIDRAVAAMREAASGQIVVDDATANLLDARFSVAGGRLRGMREARDHDGGMITPERTVLGRATPTVGRDRELATLEALWAECTDESVARVALVTAPPGGGKSRVRQELVRRVLQRDEHAELLVGRADSLRAGSPFAMLADAIRRAAGVREGDAIDEQRAALRARVVRHVPDRDGDPTPVVDRVTHLLGEIAGVPFPSEAGEALRAARGDPHVRGDAMREAWITWLAAETKHHPMLLVLEDLHWGDRPTIDLVDAALRELAQAPFMVVALARPEVHDQFPRLWSERAVQELRLPELTRKASERLVRDLLGATVASDTVHRIVDRSAGNAFFLEELIRAVAEGRDATLPDSVLSMLQLRLDALGIDARRVLRAASVFGETFWRGGVARLVDTDPRDCLGELVQRELVVAVPHSSIPGEPEYAFRHDLVREAAYATTSPADRALAHELAGEWLVEHGHSDAVELALHFSRGNRPRRAAEFYARAAEQALAGNDDAAALAHAARGLASDPGTELAARLHLATAEARNWRGEYAEAMVAADGARAASPAGSTTWFRAGDELFYGAGRLGVMPRAMATLRDLTATPAAPDALAAQVRSVSRATIVMLRFGPPGVGMALVEVGERLARSAPPSIEMDQRLHTVRGLVARARGEAGRCIAEHEAALRACEVVHNLRESAFTDLAFGGVYQELGRNDLAEPVLRRGLAVAERIGVTTVATLLRFSLGQCVLEQGRFDDARAYCMHALAGCTEADHSAEGLTRWILARIAFATGDRTAARDELARALDRLASFPEFHTVALGEHARFAVAFGDVDEARAAIARARARMRQHDGFELGESLVRLVEIEVLEAARDPAAAGALAAAVERLRTRAARIEEPWRSSFLARPENAATLARGA